MVYSFKNDILPIKKKKIFFGSNQLIMLTNIKKKEKEKGI